MAKTNKMRGFNVNSVAKGWATAVIKGRWAILAVFITAISLAIGVFTALR